MLDLRAQFYFLRILSITFTQPPPLIPFRNHWLWHKQHCFFILRLYFRLTASGCDLNPPLEFYVLQYPLSICANASLANVFFIIEGEFSQAKWGRAPRFRVTDKNIYLFYRLYFDFFRSACVYRCYVLLGSLKVPISGIYCFN